MIDVLVLLDKLLFMSSDDVDIHDVSLGSDAIINLDNHASLTKSITRFRGISNGSKLKYVPYSLDYYKLINIDNRVSFINPGMNEECTFTNFNRFLYQYTTTNRDYQFTMYRPKLGFRDKLIKVSYNLPDRSYRSYDISILGILCLLSRYHYNDKVFIDYIENNYLKHNYEWSDTYGLWILNKVHRDKLGITKDFIIQLIDLNYNMGIRYKDNKIPYTFSWRD